MLFAVNAEGNQRKHKRSLLREMSDGERLSKGPRVDLEVNTCVNVIVFLCAKVLSLYCTGGVKMVKLNLYWMLALVLELILDSLGSYRAGAMPELWDVATAAVATVLFGAMWPLVHLSLALFHRKCGCCFKKLCNLQILSRLF